MIFRLRSIKTKLSHLQIFPSLESHTVKGCFFLSETQHKHSAIPLLFLPLWESLLFVGQIHRDSTNLAHLSRHGTSLVFTNTLRKLVWEVERKVEKRKIHVVQGFCAGGEIEPGDDFVKLLRKEAWKSRLRRFCKDINLLLKYKIIYLNAARLKERISSPKVFSIPSRSSVGITWSPYVIGESALISNMAISQHHFWGFNPLGLYLAQASAFLSRTICPLSQRGHLKLF